MEKRVVLRRPAAGNPRGVVPLTDKIVVEADALDDVMLAAELAETLGVIVPPRLTALLRAFKSGGMAALAQRSATAEEGLQVATIAGWLRTNQHVAPQNEGAEKELTSIAGAVAQIVEDTISKKASALEIGRAYLEWASTTT